MLSKRARALNSAIVDAYFLKPGRVVEVGWTSGKDFQMKIALH